MTHPAIQAGHTAVITGAADGIGLAAARRFAGLGLNVVMVDRDEAKLTAAAETVSGGEVMAIPADVTDLAALSGVRDAAFTAFGGVQVLMNNAGVGGGGSALERPEAWRRLIEVNLFGVLNGVQTFGPRMAESGAPGLIVNTGSKQGITTPPGDTAYNVSKAGVKALTEGLAHTLRNTEGCQVTAHLLIPGYTFTGMTSRGAAEKPAAAWSADQVVEFMLQEIGRGAFYILCPDNDVDRATDVARIRWAAEDVASGRPALSRWHPDWKERFDQYMAQEAGK